MDMYHHLLETEQSKIFNAFARKVKSKVGDCITILSQKRIDLVFSDVHLSYLAENDIKYLCGDCCSSFIVLMSLPVIDTERGPRPMHVVHARTGREEEEDAEGGRKERRAGGT